MVDFPDFPKRSVAEASEFLCTFTHEVLYSYVCRSTSSLILNDCALGLWFKFDGYQCIADKNMKVTMQPRPQKVLKAINTIEHRKQPLGR